MSGEISVFGRDSCEDTMRTRQHLDELGVPYRYVNIEKDPDARRLVEEWNHGRRTTPTILIGGGHRTRRLAQPSDEELDLALRDQGLLAA